jgi:3D (Asp-Asp-Asp) domain-containing protein
MNKPTRARYGALVRFLFCTALIVPLSTTNTATEHTGGLQQHRTKAVIGSKKFGPFLPHRTAPVVASRGVDVSDDDLWLITAYTAGEESTGKSPSDPLYGVTASGTHVKEGDCACDASIPFGTRFAVPSVGIVTCTDRGGAIKGEHLDVYFADLDKALQFGRKMVRVREIR